MSGIILMSMDKLRPINSGAYNIGCSESVLEQSRHKNKGPIKHNKYSTLGIGELYVFLHRLHKIDIDSTMKNYYNSRICNGRKCYRARHRNSG